MAVKESVVFFHNGLNMSLLLGSRCLCPDCQVRYIVLENGA